MAYQSPVLGPPYPAEIVDRFHSWRTPGELDVWFLGAKEAGLSPVQPGPKSFLQTSTFKRSAPIDLQKFPEYNPALGAANLADRTWLYGGSVEAVTESIANGRLGIMPSFDGRLDDTRIKLLVALPSAKSDAIANRGE